MFFLEQETTGAFPITYIYFSNKGLDLFLHSFNFNIKKIKEANIGEDEYISSYTDLINTVKSRMKYGKYKGNSIELQNQEYNISYFLPHELFRFIYFLKQETILIAYVSNL